MSTSSLHAARLCRRSCASQNGNGGQEDGLRHAECVESVRHQLQLQVCDRTFTVDGTIPLRWQIRELQVVLLLQNTVRSEGEC